MKKMYFETYEFTQSVRNGPTFRGATESNSFNLNKIWFSQLDQRRVVVHFLRVPTLHQGQPVHGSLSYKILSKFRLLEVKLFNGILHKVSL